MAKIRYGMLAGSVSGSQGNTVFSHNRYGAYLRNRTVPTKTTTPAAQTQKGILSAASKVWGNLTTAQRTAWKTWAQTHPITDTLGDKRILTGHAAVTQINAAALAAGAASPILDPPIAAAPFLPDGLAAVYDIGAGNFQITWTSGALGASEKLVIRAAVVDSAGRSYVQNLYKLVMYSPAAGTSPQVTQTAVADRFGTLAVGQQVFYSLQVIDVDTGLYSGTYPLNGVIVST